MKDPTGPSPRTLQLTHTRVGPLSSIINGKGKENENVNPADTNSSTVFDNLPLSNISWMKEGLIFWEADTGSEERPNGGVAQLCRVGGYRWIPKIGTSNTAKEHGKVNTGSGMGALEQQEQGMDIDP